MGLVPSVKICGITDEAALEAAIASGADYVGFVFYEPSSRYVTPQQAAKLYRKAAGRAKCVGVFVNPSDKKLQNLELDIIQLHGDEKPLRVRQVKELTGLPVIKAIQVAEPEDLEGVESYESAADYIMFDTKVEGVQGGTGQSFDWNIIKTHDSQKPWFLAGGLNAENIAQALKVLKPDAVDVSSGVESAPGQKDPAKIKAFIEAVKARI